MRYSYTITPNDHFINVKDVLKNYFMMSSRLFSKLNKSNFIFLNNSPSSSNSFVFPGDIVSFSMDFIEDSSNIVPVNMELNIVYEDDSLLIVNKPANLSVHPTSYHFTDTLSNGIKYYFNNINLPKKIRVVNRLDRNTSGLVVIAKNEYVQDFLIKQMNARIFEKKYIGIATGDFSCNQFTDGTIDAPIARKQNSIIERCVDPMRRKSNYSF